MRRTLLAPLAVLGIVGAVILLVLGILTSSMAQPGNAPARATATVTKTVTATATVTMTVTATAAAAATATATATLSTSSSTSSSTSEPTTSAPPPPTTPTASSSSPAASDWPGPGNTGVPPGTVLTAYTGPCVITTDNLRLDAKTINCPNGLEIQAADVTITRSTVNGSILVDTDVNRSWSMTLTDSEVAGYSGDLPAIYNGNATLLRDNIHGGHNGLECQEHSNHCSIKDSWIHDQYDPHNDNAHVGGMLVLGNVVPCTGPNGVCAEIVHNSITCDSSTGCTGDLNLLPHFGPLPGALIKDNYLGANAHASFCTYGGSGMEYPADHIVYIGNVVARGTNGLCAAYGPVTNFDSSAAGNVWDGNVWDDGTRLPPGN